MHFHTTVLAPAALAALSTVAFAQSAPIPVSGPVRHAGTYHVDTGTWMRHAATASLGADVVYDNTCPTGYFFPLDDDTLIDEGRVPSPTSPLNASSLPGCAVAYTIDGIELAYCTTQSPTTGFLVDFHQSYVGCSTLIGVTPTQSLVLPMPGSGTPGGLACWIATIDLGLQSFTMLGDGDGAYTGVSEQNLFGWSIRLAAPSPSTGPFIAGAPTVCGRGAGTVFDTMGTGGPGTGLGTLDQYRLEGGTSPASCYWGSGNIYRSFHLKLHADACSGPTGQPFCAGNGGGAACPCGNFSPPGTSEGCFNTTLRGGKLVAIGDASLANDTIVLYGAQMPPNSSALFFQGTLRENGGLGTAFGDGLRCAGGTTRRLGVSGVNAGGNAYYPSSGSQPTVSAQGLVAGPGIRTYQVWYRNAAPFCTPAVFNFSNGWSLAWGA